MASLSILMAIYRLTLINDKNYIKLGNRNLKYLREGGRMYVKLVFTIIFFLIAGNTALAEHNHQHRKPVTMQMNAQHHTMDSIGEQ